MQRVAFSDANNVYINYIFNNATQKLHLTDSKSQMQKVALIFFLMLINCTLNNTTQKLYSHSINEVSNVVQLSLSFYAILL